MALTTTNMGLTVWDQLTDYFNHSELQENFELLDVHDHTTGKGLQIPDGGLAPDSVGSANIKDASITGVKIVDGSVTSQKMADGVIGTTGLVDNSVTAAKMADNAIGVEELDTATNDFLGISESSTKRRASFFRSAGDTITSTTYAFATNADKVTGIQVKAGGLLFIGYHAAITRSAASTAKAAIFIGSNQLKTDTLPAPAIQEATLTQTATEYAVLRTAGTSGGLVTVENNGNSYSGDVTTGTAISSVAVFVPTAGTYDVGVKFKSSSGDITVNSRRLYVWTADF